MNRRKKVAVVGALVALAACMADDNPSSLVITGFVVPDVDEQFGCTISAESELQRSVGYLDVLLSQYRDSLGQSMTYFAYPVVLNQIETETPDRDTVTIEGFEVDLSYPYEVGDPGYNAAIDQLVAAATGFMVPRGDSIASGEERPFYVEVIPASLAYYMAAAFGGPEDPQLQEFTVEASMRATGQRAGNHVESATITYPIYICKGCRTLGVISPTGPLGCDQPTGIPMYAGDPCSGLPRDAYVTCCWDTVEDEQTGASALYLQCPHPQALDQDEGG